MENTIVKSGEMFQISIKSEKKLISIEKDEVLQFDRDYKLVKSNEHLVSGFIDIHIHGAVGVDVNVASAEDLRRMGKFLASKGVTGWLPTFVPDADEVYRKIVDAIDKVMETQDSEDFESAARILGVHYEGVFANEKMCGALRPQYFKKFTGAEIAQLPRLRKGVHLTTLAPEVENGIALIEKLIEENWIVAIGHTNASTDILDAAYKAGARHLTHFFNAMTPIHHREIGVAGWALANEDVTFDIIADGVHVDPRMLKVAIDAKTTDKVSLISDAVLPTGMGDGVFTMWDEQISVVKGRTRNERGGIAGSVITMLDAVKMMRLLGYSEDEISKMVSANPAKLLGLDHEIGSLEIGKRADFVAFDENGNISLTVIGGRIAYQK